MPETQNIRSFELTSVEGRIVNVVGHCSFLKLTPKFIHEIFVIYFRYLTEINVHISDWLHTYFLTAPYDAEKLI